MAGPTTGSLRSSTGKPPVEAVTGIATGTFKFGSSAFKLTKEFELQGGAIYFEGYIDEIVTLATGGATTDTTATIPSGAFEVTVATRVTTTITTAANFSVGISGAATRFLAASTNITAGDTNSGAATANAYTSATNIRITANATPGAGAVRVTAWIRGIRAATSST